MIKIRKIQSLIMAFALLAGWSAAVLVDDFNSYNLGAVNTVAAPNWVAGSDNGTSPSTASIVVDPVDSGNQVIQLTEGGSTSQQWVRSTLTPTAAIDVGETSTVYFRVKTTTTLDSSFGLTDLDTASNDWAHFRLQFIFHNAWQIREGSSILNLAYSTGTAVPWNTGWYNVWLVVTNSTTAPVVKVYMNQSDTDATEADRCVNAANLTQNTFGFRVNAAGALDNVFWRAQNNPSDRMAQIDDLNITLGTDLSVPAKTKPYSPFVDPGTPSGTNIPTTLRWKAGADPDGVYTVNPAIVDEYVFTSSGDPKDPNVYYVGATGVDPGTTDPNSEYSLTWAMDKTYYWAIVEAIDGYQHDGTHKPLLTAGTSKLSNVDPNNIIGSTWSYVSTKSTPTIVTEPVDVRVFTTDPNAVFTVTFTSVNQPTATWYKNGAAMTAGGDVSITTTSTSSRLTIATPVLADEGKYYCILSVDPLKTTDDIQTATRLLVIKKMLAQFNFEQSLTDSSGNAAPAGQGKSVAGLTEPNELQASNVTLTYDPNGIQGYAVYLNGSQYVDFGIEGYPKAGPLNTLGDIRGASYEKTGFGRGMEQGSLLCWIKPNSTGAIYMNANNNTAPATDDTHFGLSTTSTNNARMIVRGENAPDGGYQEIGTASGGLQMTNFTLQDGQWHMFAATWENDTVRVYINGEQVATNTAGTPEKYNPWERSNLLGASRTAGTRHILNSFLTGAIDSMRVYNYVISTDAIATEYETLSGNTPCANHSFEGNAYNFDNTASSYCKVDIVDFLMVVTKWLDCGLYPVCP